MVPGLSACAATMATAMMAMGIAASWLGEIDTVNNNLDEGDIILHKHGTRLIKSSLSHEQWVSTGDVHLGHWLLEGRVGLVGAQDDDDVVTAGLVKHHHVDLLAEGPLEEGVKLTTHDDKEEGDVGGLAHAVPVKVDASTHLVTCNSVRPTLKQTLVWLISRMHCLSCERWVIDTFIDTSEC